MFGLRTSGIGKLQQVAVFAILMQLTSVSASSQAHPPSATEPGRYTISVDVGLVVLPVIVTDRAGKVVPGLGEGSFQVFEDGRPQHITLFQTEDVPIAAGLVIDNSGSMRAKRTEVLAAAEEFARSSNSQDQMFVVTFNQTISLGLPHGVPFTSNVQDLLAAVSRTPAYGKTALYDGLAAALQHLSKGTRTRRALVLISDGGDNASRLSFRQLLRQAETSNAEIYTVGVFDPNFEGEDSSGLRKLAKVTGGQAYFPESVSEIPGICRQIALNLRQQYTIGYHPVDSNM